MSRTLRQRLDHAAALTVRLEAGELVSFGRRSGGPLHRLGQAFVATTEADLDVAHAVGDARAAGYTWEEIGSVLGTSGTAASKRYRRELPRAGGFPTIVQLRIPLRRPAGAR